MGPRPHTKKNGQSASERSQGWESESFERNRGVHPFKIFNFDGILNPFMLGPEAPLPHREYAPQALFLFLLLAFNCKGPEAGTDGASAHEREEKDTLSYEEHMTKARKAMKDSAFGTAHEQYQHALLHQKRSEPLQGLKKVRDTLPKPFGFGARNIDTTGFTYEDLPHSVYDSLMKEGDSAAKAGKVEQAHRCYERARALAAWKAIGKDAEKALERREDMTKKIRSRNLELFRASSKLEKLQNSSKVPFIVRMTSYSRFNVQPLGHKLVIDTDHQRMELLKDDRRLAERIHQRRAKEPRNLLWDDGDPVERDRAAFIKRVETDSQYVVDMGQMVPVPFDPTLGFRTRLSFDPRSGDFRTRLTGLNMIQNGKDYESHRYEQIPRYRIPYGKKKGSSFPERCKRSKAWCADLEHWIIKKEGKDSLKYRPPSKRAPFSTSFASSSHGFSLKQGSSSLVTFIAIAHEKGRLSIYDTPAMEEEIKLTWKELKELDGVILPFLFYYDERERSFKKSLKRIGLVWEEDSVEELQKRWIHAN